MSGSPPAQPHFIDGDAGKLFVMEYPPATTIRGTVLFAPPFAEEMNRARRMVSLQSRKFSSLGYQVIVPDLFGTGDSQGDFGDARWEIWRRDLSAALIVADASSVVPTWLWGLRLGALLALDAVRHGLIEASRFLLWSPCTDGKQFLTQFLRMRLLAGMIVKSEPRESVSQLKAAMLQNGSLEVAGYSLSSRLAGALEQLSIEQLVPARTSATVWFELVGGTERTLLPPVARMVKKLAERDRGVLVQAVEGPAFWSTPEISVSDNLLKATSAVFAAN